MKDNSLDYTRQSLRKATKFVEGDYKGINPRQFYRSLKRSLEEIQEGGEFKYTTEGTQERDLEIESEDVGEKTGKVRGRLLARSDPRVVGSGEITYRPYGPHGAVSIVVGFLIFVIGLAGSEVVAFLGAIAMLGGGYGYLQKDVGEYPIQREDVIRILLSGEVSERTIQDGEESRTDIFANMSVIYAGDAFLSVSVAGLEDIPWTQRRAVKVQVKNWFNRLNEDSRVEVGEGFIAELASLANISAESDFRKIESLQQTINSEFETRIEYTEILIDELPHSLRDELADHQEGLMDELESLSEDMDVYVEREGLERVS